MKIFLSALVLLCCLVTAAQKKYYMLAGTYTNGKSIGVYVYNFDSNTGTATVVDSIKTSNPSYLAVSPSEKFVYAVNENADNGNGGKVTAFSFDKKTGHLTQLNQQLSMGDNPCYITVDKTGKWVAVANYSSGTAAVLPVHKDGSLGKAVSVIQHKGSSVNKQRQEGPHVHATVLSPDNHQLFVSDLGIDKLMVYSFNEHTGKLTAAKDSVVKLTPGSGPRHFVFHPNHKWAYLIQEMGGTITAFNYKNGTLKKLQTVSTVPASFTKSFTGADIHISPDGKFLYASNRDSSNTISIFKINAQNGKLTMIGNEAAQGKTPRNFNFDPTANYLLVANQNSDDIIIFRRNAKTGLLRDTGKRIAIGNPVCIKWIE
jgi:6-phosphogluconolactonase